MNATNRILMLLQLQLNRERTRLERALNFRELHLMRDTSIANVDNDNVLHPPKATISV